MHKGYKCFHIPTGRLYIFHDVLFEESIFPFLESSILVFVPSPTNSSTGLPNPLLLDHALQPLLRLVLSLLAQLSPSSPHISPHKSLLLQIPPLPHYLLLQKTQSRLTPWLLALRTTSLNPEPPPIAPSFTLYPKLFLLPLTPPLPNPPVTLQL